MELSFYKYLLELKATGEVLSIILQPKMILIEKFEKYGKKYRNTTYTPDFLVEYSDGRKEYIDIKGFSTDASKLRRKLFDSIYSDTLRWITQSKKWSPDGSTWLDYDLLQKLRKNNKKTKEAI
jgi:hypothetical protein